MIKACIFDLDGTLVNSLEDLADSANFALAQCGLPVHPVHLYRYFVGGGIPKLIERIVPQGTEPAVRERVHTLFGQQYEGHCLEKTRPYGEIPELLEALRARGILSGVFSNKDHAFTGRIVSSLFDEGTFAFVQGMEAGMPKKPDPTGLFTNLEKLGLAPRECLYLGDSGVDMRTAQNAGCPSVGVLWGFREEKELLENGAGSLIRTPLEVLACL